MGFSLFRSSTTSSKPKTAYVFSAQGQLQRLELPVTVAELMFEAPGYIVCPFDELRVSRVISALRANDELQAGGFYLMFSAKKAYSKVSELDLEIIKVACKKKGKKGVTVGSKVFPAGNEEQEEGEAHNDSGFSSSKSGNAKHWRPMLEPIHEAL
ncbi:hypothetical protein ACHQM5_026313 [Ranunculus cassubicifolius]